MVMGMGASLLEMAMTQFLRKKSLWLCLTLLTTVVIIVTARGSTIAAAYLGHQLGYPPAPHGVSLERHVTIRAPDGIALVADIYHPRTAESTPTILVRIPYSKKIRHILFARTIGHLWASHGYTTVIQGTRGRYESGGSYDPPFLNESQDGFVTLEWIAQQPWYNGKIGTWGGSYFGYTQWVLANHTDPGLSALILQICSTDFYRMFYPGGAFSLESALYWATLSYGQKDIPIPQNQLQQGYDGWPLLEADDRAVQDIPFFNTWAGTPQRNAYWQAVDGRDRSHDLQGPALLMAGWYDPFLPTQIEDFAAIQAHAAPEVAQATRLVIGPWTHANTVTFPDGAVPRSYRLESIVPSLPWFDQHLKGESQTAYPSAVCIFVMGANIWRHETEWRNRRHR